MSAEVETNVLVSDEASVARVEVYLPGATTFARTGSAKKHPNDPSVSTVGEALALSRALSQVAADLEAYALETNAKHIEDRERDKSVQKLLDVLGIEG